MFPILLFIHNLLMYGSEKMIFVQKLLTNAAPLIVSTKRFCHYNNYRYDSMMQKIAMRTSASLYSRTLASHRVSRIALIDLIGKLRIFE